MVLTSFGEERSAPKKSRCPKNLKKEGLENSQACVTSTVCNEGVHGPSRWTDQANVLAPRSLENRERRRARASHFTSQRRFGSRFPRRNERHTRSVTAAVCLISWRCVPVVAIARRLSKAKQSRISSERTVETESRAGCRVGRAGGRLKGARKTNLPTHDNCSIHETHSGWS